MIKRKEANGVSYFNIAAETTKNSTVTKYEPTKQRHSCGYQSEATLEQEFIRLLCEQGYEYLPIHKEKDLILNLRKKLESLNHYNFSDTEWERFFKNTIANPNDDIVEKTRKIQENDIQSLICDDGLLKNIKLIDKKNIHNNSLQVINQYTDDDKYNNRYDVTVLVNGLPLVHIELKRRGVAIREAFNQIDRYWRDSFWSGSKLFEYIQIFVISNGTNTKYYSNSTRRNAENEKKGSKSGNSFEFTNFWADANKRVISDLVDFTKTFFAKHTILNILTKYCVFTSNALMVMRPHQIIATERILNRIEIANNYKTYGSVKGGGYIWHITGSDKTLTSFKTAMLASELPYIDKVLFIVGKDFDYLKEYDYFKGANSTATLKKQLESADAKIIITTIQKLAAFVKRNPGHEVYTKHIVIIFDECHRRQFGDMHTIIVKNFKKYHLFGFTGTPISGVNSSGTENSNFFTTEQTFGDQLHSYTIDDEICEKELNRQIEINIDYILMLVQKYQDYHFEDKEVLITIGKAIDASPQLRSQKKLIKNFIAGVEEADDVVNEWNSFVNKRRKNDIQTIIKEEKLNPEDTRKFMENAFRDGGIKTSGTYIDKLMPPISRFLGDRAKKKQRVIEKLKIFFEKYFGIGGSSSDLFSK